MNLPGISIRRPITTTMMILIIMVLGLVASFRIGIDFFPDIQFPTITIMTNYPGAASQEVENIVSRPLEEAVSAVAGVKKIRSTSREGFSIIMVEFRWGTDLSEAAQEARNVIEQTLDRMPDEVERPMVLKSDIDMMPILYYGIYSTTGRNLRNLRKLAEDVVEKKLDNLPGVATVMIGGGLEREILISADRNRLKAHNITINDIIRTIQAQNRDIPGGHVIKGTEEYVVRTIGKYKTIRQISDTVIKIENRVPVYVRDVARVEDSHKELRYIQKTNMKDSVVMWITKESGANTVEVVDAVRRELKKIKAILPQDVQMLNVWDTSKLIRDSVDRLRETALWGGSIAFLVLLVFLWNLRTTLTLAISIPFAVVTTFIGIYCARYTLNMITLSGLALSVGMILDNSIVVLENIFRHMEKGEDKKEAARAGATEVSMAITASTLTSVIVFLPMVFASGIVGQFARPLGLTVTIALFASLLIALTMIPMIASRFLKVKKVSEESKTFAVVQETYKRILEKALRHRILTVSGGVGLFIISLLIFSFFVGGEVLPKLDEIYSSAIIRMKPGTKLDETYGFVEKVEKAIMELPEFRSIISMAGLSESSKMDSAQGAGAVGVDEALIYYEIAPKRERKRTAVEIMDSIRAKLPILAKGAFYFMQTNDYLTRGGERSIEINLFGNDMSVLKKVSDQVVDRLRKEKGIVDVDSSLKMGKPEMQITVDRDKASSMGITVLDVASTVDAAFLGKKVSTFRDQGEEYDIRVRFSRQDRKSANDLNDVLIAAPGGFLVNLIDVAQVTEGRGPVKIERENQERVVTISADATTADLRNIEKKVKQVLDSVALPEGYFFNYGGSLEDMQEMTINMLFTMGLIILLVYMVMAAQFESLSYPFAIMFAVPLAIVGVSLALFLTNTTLSVMSFIGIMILIGVVVNNGIVLIDYVNQLRIQGMERTEAILQGGITRLRPILMTTLTTILALLPMALNRGEGAELFAPISITLFGGLLVSTLLTLIIVPSLYSLIDDIASWAGEKIRN